MDQSTTQSKESGLFKAGSAVADSLAQFERAMNDLVDRMEITGEHLQNLREIKERAENMMNQVVGASQRAVNEVKRNPLPYLVLAAAAGVFLLSRSRGGRISLHQP